TLEQASAVADAVQARLDQGLATRPDLLLAVQERARAAFEVREAEGQVDDARAALAESVGISPTVTLQIADLGSVPLPADLPATAEHLIDGSLARRPDVASKLAVLRAREAELRRARADFLPQLRATGSVGGETGHYTFGSVGPFDYTRQTYGAFLLFDWKVF